MAHAQIQDFVLMRLKCDDTHSETRFCLSAQRTSPFKSAGKSFHSTTGRRAIDFSLQGFYCSCKPVFCSHVTLTGYAIHSPVSPSLLLRCVTVRHHISNAVRQNLVSAHVPSHFKSSETKSGFCACAITFQTQ